MRCFRFVDILFIIVFIFWECFSFNAHVSYGTTVNYLLTGYPVRAVKY